jgi:hypothetical protein
MGNGFLTIALFISLKLLTNRTQFSFFGIVKVSKAHLEYDCHFKVPNCIVFGFHFLRSLQTFLVLGMACHDMVVLPLLVGARPYYNPSHPVFHRIALKFFAGDSATEVEGNRP